MNRGTVILFALFGGLTCTSRDSTAVTEIVTASRSANLDRSRAASTVAKETDVRAQYGRLPMRYEENRGQHDPRARYVGRQGGLTLFATGEGPVLALRAPEPGDAPEPSRLDGWPREEPHPSRQYGLRIALEGARPKARIEPSERLVTKSNYFIGNDPSQWRTDVPNYGALTYRELARGVDLVLRGSSEGRIEYDFVVAPGTSPALELRFEGADRVTLAEDGGLRVEVGEVALEQSAPVLYQEIDGRRVGVDGRYRLVGRDRVRFDVGAYDRRRPLVIDPVLVYSTYLGGSTSEIGRGIAVDATGAAYVAGFTSSTDFPGTTTPMNGGVRDVFVAKLAAAGNALEYATYLGGSNDENGYAIALDSSGAAYITGDTLSTNFPTTTGALQTTSGGRDDAFIAKLTPAGNALAFATYLGGTFGELGIGIAVDSLGAAYVTGQTASSDFPSSPGAVQSAPGGSTDAFVAKLDPKGHSLAYATYLGGTGVDTGLGIATDSAGAAYVTGDTRSGNFPVSTGALQSTSGGSDDAFVAKLAPAGNALTYSTYLGGSGADYGNGIALDGFGAAYITGNTTSSNFPTSAGALQTSLGGGIVDAFVVKLVPSGNAVAYATYFGGTGADHGSGIAVDVDGAAFVCGDSASTNLPTSPGAVQSTNGGGSQDAFVLRLAPAGNVLTYATYLGGSNYEEGHAVALDAAGSAYVAGYTVSGNFPVTPGSTQSTMNGLGDVFLTKLQFPRPTGATCTSDSTCASGFCTDGVCCDARCAGGASDCQACSTAAGAATNGTCGPTTGNSCDDGLACTVGTICSAGTCAGGTSPCLSGTTCSEAASATYTCSPCPAGTFSADGTGATACMACASGTWSKAGATGCMAWSDCAPGEAVTNAGSATSDRACAACGAGMFSTTTNAPSCTAWTECAAGEYVVTPGTAKGDRVCGKCAAGSFSTVANATSCSAWTECAAGEHVTAEGSATADRGCGACASGSFSTMANAASCVPWTDCTRGERVATEGTASTDRVCSACAAGTYSTATNAAACAACTACGTGEVETGACTATSNRVCAASAPDAGVVEAPDAASADPVPEPGTATSGCGCASTGAGSGTGGSSGLVLLFALGLAFRVGRRDGAMGLCRRDGRS